MEEFRDTYSSPDFNFFGRRSDIARPLLQQHTSSVTPNAIYQQQTRSLTLSTPLQQHHMNVVNGRGSLAAMNHSPPNTSCSFHRSFPVARREVHRPVTDSRIFGTMDLFFADLFWNAMKECSPDYARWNTVESMRNDYPSVWSNEVSKKVSVYRQQSQVFIFELSGALKRNIEEAVTRDPNHLRAIFDRHVRQVALRILCGNDAYKKFLIFCALVTEMFISCVMNNSDFPINLVITSVADLACPYMKWQGLEDVIFFASQLGLSEKETSD